VHRAALAGESGPEDLEHAICLHERTPEPIRVLAIVGTLRLVSDRTAPGGYLVRPPVNLHLRSSPTSALDDAPIEGRHATEASSGNERLPAVTRFQDQLVIDEVEIDLKPYRVP
jgi:hypothetical protein